ncbi:hypothetical protein HRI_003763500 [Hibiscus trionum]|uniref:Uncharacterized protein n=1 Tax=Hibiscus trionum TaxID=183268 RepID=A0A9W7ITZ8_HIBTR|nr:hypothetical protein HRI_003763500 [Hibiscus trionum]
MKTASESEEAGAALDIWDCGSPLYDSYELVSLSHKIERHLMTLPSLGGSNRNPHRSDVTPATPADNGRAKESSSLRRRLGKFLVSKIWKRRKVCSKEGQAVAFARDR